ncbi:MAG: signal peptidase II [Myxococcota bacterium]
MTTEEQNTSNGHAPAEGGGFFGDATSGLVPPIPEKAAPQAPRWAKLLLLPAVVSMTLALDQGTKLLAQAELAEAVETAVPQDDGTLKQVKVWRPTRSVTVVPGLFNFRYVENPAAAFSLTINMPEKVRKPFLVAVSILAMVLILSWYWRTREPDWLVLSSFSFILGGALGNLVDRMAYGYVIDFIDWHLSIINPSWHHWPTFNIADAAICVGAAGVILRTFKPYQAPKEAEGQWQSEALVESGRPGEVSGEHEAGKASSTSS